MFTRVSGLTDSVHVTHVGCGGEHTVFVSQDNDVYAAGSNLMGQLGLITPISNIYSSPQSHQAGRGQYRPLSTSHHPQLMALLKRSGRQVPSPLPLLLSFLPSYHDNPSNTLTHTSYLLLPPIYASSVGSVGGVR